MKWSSFQLDVFDFVKNSIRSAVIKAVAGSGKTTTIVEVANRIPANLRTVFLAFNKSIALELGKRLPEGVESKTLNALGFKAWARSIHGKCQVDKDKTRKITEMVVGELRLKWDYNKPVNQIIGLCKQHGLAPDGIQGVSGLGLINTASINELVNHYSIELPDICSINDLSIVIVEVLKRSISIKGQIDFDDMMYMMVIYDCNVSKYDFIMVDEAQDVSPIQRAMIKKFLAPGGRLLAVGDEAQAIYGFRGADSNSLNQIIEEFDCETLHLSVCYRCAKNIVKKAQTILPEIQYHESMPDGVVKEVDIFNANDFNEKTDMVVCRNVAPLIGLVYEMLSYNMPSHILGRDIGQGLIDVISKVVKKYPSNNIIEFLHGLDKWANKEIEKASILDQESKVDMIQDQLGALQVIIDYNQPENPRELKVNINALFAKSSGIKLCTVHKSKGLEQERVFIYQPELMPSKYARQAWQKQQELNLMYVAYTRAMNELIFFNGIINQS